MHHNQLKLVQTPLAYINSQPVGLLTVPKARTCHIIFQEWYLDVKIKCCCQLAFLTLASLGHTLSSSSLPSLHANTDSSPSCQLLGVCQESWLLGMDGGARESQGMLTQSSSCLLSFSLLKLSGIIVTRGIFGKSCFKVCCPPGALAL